MIVCPVCVTDASFHHGTMRCECSRLTVGYRNVSFYVSCSRNGPNMAVMSGRGLVVNHGSGPFVVPERDRLTVVLEFVKRAVTDEVMGS